MKRAIPEIPAADYAIIGGSSTNSIDFPADVGFEGVNILQRGLVFDTPFGETPEFTLFELEGKRCLTCRMHGWRRRVSRADASREIFWIFQKAMVKRILAEGGVGAIDSKLEPRDLVVPHDYIDFSLRRDVSLDTEYLLVMREALCHEVRAVLLEAARARELGRVIDQGVYVVTDGRHFESPAEVNMFKILGGDIIGQSLCPEVYLAREIGACYASIQLVVNYAEGVVPEWDYEELTDIFYGESGTISHILLEAMAGLPLEKKCGCEGLRKKTLLK